MTIEDKLNEAQKNISKLKEHEFKLSFALDCAEGLNWELSLENGKIIFSKHFEIMTGICQSDYNYDFWTFVDQHLKHDEEAIREALRKYAAGEADMASTEISLKNVHTGETLWLFVRGKYIDEERKLIYGVTVNITERKNFEQRLARMAYIDSHTGLYRLEYLSDALAGRIESVKLSNIGLMMLDIHRFRDINAVFGYEQGNAVLAQTAKRLSELTDNLIAKSDSGGFIIVFNEVAQVQELEEAGEAIRKAFERPVKIDGHSFYINFKIGIVKPKNGNLDFDTLLKDAELAVNHIKNDKMNHICVINESLRKNANDRITMIYELRQAITKKEFVLFFQPIINAKTRQVSGAEALIRWNHPTRGMLAPLTFIALAEQTGLINQIGEFVLLEALKELKKCLELYEDFYISVNVSVVQLLSIDFVQNMKSMIEKFSLSPGNLVIEVTESIFITDMAHMVDMLNQIRDMGVRVSLDDFGTGFSSLSYIKKLPIDNLKIDRSFLLDVLNNSTSEMILQSIIELACHLQLSTTAEGVETRGHLKLLKKYDCDFLQGYYFSKPIPAEELEAFLIGFQEF